MSYLAAPPVSIIDRLVDGSARVSRRVEILNSDGTLFIADPAVLAGSVSIDASRAERRTLDLVIANSDGSIELSTNGLWYDKLLVPYRGVTYLGDEGEEITWEVPLGRFMPDRFEQDNFPSDIHITARDMTKKLMNSSFQVTTAFSAGSSVGSVVRALAVNGGVTDIILPWFDPENPSPTIEATRTYEPDASRWDAIKEITTSFGYDAFLDVYGYLVVVPQADPAIDQPVWTFETGLAGNLITYHKAANDSRLYNAVLVKGEKEGQNPVSGFAEITDPDSPIHKDRIGQRIYRYTSSFIATTEQADAVAVNFLKVHGLEEFEIDLGAIVFPWLDAGQTIAFVDPDVDESQNFFLHNLEIPLALEPMTVNGRRVRIVE